MCVCVCVCARPSAAVNSVRQLESLVTLVNVGRHSITERKCRLINSHRRIRISMGSRVRMTTRERTRRGAHLPPYRENDTCYFPRGEWKNVSVRKPPENRVTRKKTNRKRFWTLNLWTGKNRKRFWPRILRTGKNRKRFSDAKRLRGKIRKRFRKQNLWA